MNNLSDLETRLADALRLALEVIESYQSDIRNSGWTGVDLLRKGFCQGRIYKNSAMKIARALDTIEDSPHHATHILFQQNADVARIAGKE
jgi:hypothetical protein